MICISMYGFFVVLGLGIIKNVLYGFFKIIDILCRKFIDFLVLSFKKRLGKYMDILILYICI